MTSPVFKKIKKWLILISIVYLSIGIVFYFLQEAILFHPVSLKKNARYSFSAPHDEINIPVNKHSSLNVVRFFSTTSVTKGIVLYFHGNKKNIGWYASYPPYFTRHGYEVWMIDYPGFGKSTGAFTEENLYRGAAILYRFAQSRFAADSLIIYGKSMGTGIAAQLASRQKCKRLILETPYFDFPSVVKHYLPIYPVEWMIHYKLPTYRYLPLVEAPVTIFQGTRDRLVTYDNARRLIPFLKKGDEFITVQGAAHNDLFRFEKTTKKLDSVLSR
jgi:hypothetical protein